MNVIEERMYPPELKLVTAMGRKEDVKVVIS